MRKMTTVAILVLAGAFVARAVAVDLTGRWTGTAQQAGRTDTVALTADLTSSGARIGGTFSATSSDATIQCTVHGAEKARRRVKIVFVLCSDGSRIVLRGKLDTAGQTITGHFARIRRGKVRGGTFTLARTASPSGAFLDDPPGL